MTRFWKFYFWIYLLLTVAPYLGLPFVQAEGSWEISHYFQVPVGVVGLLGLYGFAFSKALGRRIYWKIISLLVICFEPIYQGYSTVLEWGDVPDDLTIFALAVTGFSLIFSVPYWLALYLYGFKSSDIWQLTG